MSHTPVWSRPEPEQRTPKPPLNRASIVAAAIGLADAEGLDAVSIRRVAAILEARPMTLYRYIGSKEDLLDLMFDELVGRVMNEPPMLERNSRLPEDWQRSVVWFAVRKRRLCLTHPWVVTLYGRRPLVGPNTLELLERSIVWLRPLTTDTRKAIYVINAVDDYTMGHVSRELAFGAQASAEWQAAMRPYLAGLADSGRFPNLAEVLRAPAENDADYTFELGLDWLLDGIKI